MSALRERRLHTDHAALLAFVAAAGGRVVVEDTQGDPPDTYQLVVRCRSITAMGAGGPVFGAAHRLRLYLPAQYPAAPPVAAMRSPLVHPHVWSNGTVCLGSWNPAEKLDSILARIAAILIYDPAALNLRSVANEDAVPWARAHSMDLPLDRHFPAAARPLPQPLPAHA